MKNETFLEVSNFIVSKICILTNVSFYYWYTFIIFDIQQTFEKYPVISSVPLNVICQLH